MATKPKQLKNSYKPSPSRFRTFADPVKNPLPLYQDENGKETTDLTLAKLDPFGKPVHVGFSTSDYTLSKSSKPLCLDPADPAQRLRAIEARARMEQFILEPTIYDDPLKIAEHANNVANKVLNNITSISTNNEQQTT